MSWADRLDAAIALISPRWAAERVAWRNARSEAMSYRASRYSRTDRTTGVTGGSADFHLESGYDRDRLLQRSRQLERDNAIARGILDRVVDNVIGSGMTFQARTEDDKWNKTAEGLLEEWAAECEVRGLLSLGELQRGVYRSYLRDGDVATIKVVGADGVGRLQAIEGDLIAAPAGNRFSNRMVDGVELNRDGRPVKFWLIDENKTETRNNAGRDSMLGSIQIEAARVLFLARRTRLGQTRGEPAFAQSAALFDQIDGHVEAVVTAARMAACFGVILTRPGGFPNLPTTNDAHGTARSDFRLEPGMVKVLDTGESVSTLSPAQPSQNFSEFLATVGRLLGLPFGLPLELVFLDFSRTNYSSARASLLQAYRRFRVEQDAFIAHWLRPLALWKLEEWIRDGKLDERADWKKHVWIPPGWQWIDPQAEAAGHLMAIDAGLRTVGEIVSETGRDFEELLVARSAELKRMKALGLPEVRSINTRDPLPPKPVAAAPEKKSKSQMARVVLRG